MNKVYEIVTAWANFARPSKGMVKRAHKRYEVCKDCEFKQGPEGIEYCSQCICPLQVKIFTLKTVEEGNCPKGYWKE